MQKLPIIFVTERKVPQKILKKKFWSIPDLVCALKGILGVAKNVLFFAGKPKILFFHVPEDPAYSGRTLLTQKFCG
jgi:hypothetical protein